MSVYLISLNEILLKYCLTKNNFLSSISIALSHLGRVMHIISKLTIIGSDNGLLPGRHQAIIRTNAGILLIGPLGTHLSEIWIIIHTFSLKKMHLKMLSEKWRPFCLILNMLSACPPHGYKTSFGSSLWLQMSWHIMGFCLSVITYQWVSARKT